MNQYSLFELNLLIRECLDAGMDPSYWVIGEISEIRVNQKGHCYLELVEKKEEEIIAKMRATIWSYAWRNINAWFTSSTGDTLKQGMKILANVTVNFHEVYGISLNVREIDARYTIGERSKKRQEVLRRLIADGVDKMNKELELPLVPQRVAVISSPTAAGYQDFTDQLSGNEYGYSFHAILFPAMMQGNEAEKSMIHALHQIHKRSAGVDLVVIIRGGGASADLDCFDGYELASHVAQFPLPVITGIGHERDETIVDLVAHTSLKTPTAVAEFLITGLRNFEDQIDEYFRIINDQATAFLTAGMNKMDALSLQLGYLVKEQTGNHRNRFNLLTQKFRFTTGNYLDQSSSRLVNFTYSLKQVMGNLFRMENQKLDGKEQFIKTFSPEFVLKRGYSITTKHGRIIKDAEAVEINDPIITHLAKGQIESVITKKRE